MSGMMSFGMSGALVFAPLYFQLVLGMSPTRAGLMLLPQIGGMITVSIVSGRLVSRSGRVRPFVTAGVGLEALGLAGVGVLAWTGATPDWFELALATLGCGMGMGMPNVTTSLQNAVPARDMGAAVSAQVFLRALGASLGAAVSGAVMAGRLGGLLAARMPGTDARMVEIDRIDADAIARDDFKPGQRRHQPRVRAEFAAGTDGAHARPDLGLQCRAILGFPKPEHGEILRQCRQIRLGIGADHQQAGLVRANLVGRISAKHRRRQRSVCNRLREHRARSRSTGGNTATGRMRCRLPQRRRRAPVNTSPPRHRPTASYHQR